MNHSPAIVSGSGQFRATRTWNALVQHLKETANVKRRRNIKKAYDECFTGTNAVDVLLHFVKQNPDQFTNSLFITRDNILRLCQSFLDNAVFEPIGGPSENEKNMRFEDSTSALYQFTEKGRLGLDAGVTRPIGSRQVLKEIDGDIRNSLDHISISSTSKKETTPKSKHMLIPTRRTGQRSRFPSFTGPHSYKEVTIKVSDSEEEEKAPRKGRPLKRSSSLVGRVMKRSSSSGSMDRSQKSSTSSASDGDQIDGKDKRSDSIGRGKLRLSQRLTFRKKSFSSSDQEDNKTDETVTAVAWHNPTVTSQTIQHCLDPRRRSYAATKSDSSKPPMGMRRMISTPLLLAKSRRLTKTKRYNVSDPNHNMIQEERLHLNNIENTESKSRLRSNTLSKPLIKSRFNVNQTTHLSCASPPKICKKDSDAIKETPSRTGTSKSYMSSLATFANRMSLRRKSLRKNEVHSCVISNPSAGNGSTNAGFHITDELGSEVKRKLSPQELSHLKRECVRVRLLQIIDLQFVDSLIMSPTDKKNQTSLESGNVSGTSHGVQYSEVVSAYSSEDPWISSAVAVLHHLPNGYNILCKHARDHSNLKKLKLFFAISEYYKSLTSPIIEESMQEIVSSIVELLGTKPVSESLEATQLFIHLLPDSLCAELQDLVTFLHYVIKSKDVVLMPSQSNKTLILQTFPSAIFYIEKHETASVESGEAGMFLFMLEHRRQVFTLPASVEVILKRKKRLLESGQVDSPSLVPDSIFCTMISKEEFNTQRSEFTAMQVSELARSLSSHPTLAPKKKKDLLKKMQALHSAAFEHSRGPMKATRPLSAAPNAEVAEPAILRPKQKTPVLRTPSSDPLSRRRNKSRQKQIYV